MCIRLTGNFYDDFEGGTFGTVKKGVRRPLSNFALRFLKKIVAQDSKSTGYLVEVNPEEAVNDNSRNSGNNSELEYADGSSE